MATTTDLSGFVRQVAQVRAAQPVAARAAVVMLGKEAARLLVLYAPRDTNRYVRGWMMAANQAGVGPFGLPALEKAAGLARVAQRLEYQRGVLTRRVNRAKESVLYWQNLYQHRYVDKNRKDKWARDCQARVRDAEKKLERAEQLLARNDEESQLLNQYAIFFGARREREGRADIRTLGDIGRVSAKPYGGEGSLIEYGGALYVLLHNKEPHSQLVESKFGVVAKARRLAKGSGLVKARAAVAAVLAQRVEQGQGSSLSVSTANG